MPTDVVAEIDTQLGWLLRTRSVFPRLGQHMIGHTSFTAPDYYRHHGFAVEVELQQPMTKEFIDTMNELGHWLNENFVLRLFAVLDANGFYSPKLDLTLPGCDEMDIARRLRNLIGHGSPRFDPADPEKQKLYERIVQHFNVTSETYLTDSEKFPIAVGQVLAPMARGCQAYVKAKIAATNAGPQQPA